MISPFSNPPGPGIFSLEKLFSSKIPPGLIEVDEEEEGKEEEEEEEDRGDFP